MSRVASNCGDSNHMRVPEPNVEFLRGRDLYKGWAVVLHTAATVSSNPRLWSRVAGWNERVAVCI